MLVLLSVLCTMNAGCCFDNYCFLLLLQRSVTARAFDLVVAPVQILTINLHAGHNQEIFKSFYTTLPAEDEMFGGIVLNSRFEAFLFLILDVRINVL